jgi:hypothetical protein
VRTLAPSPSRRASSASRRDFAEPRRAEHQGETRRAFRDRFLEDRQEAPQLRLAADEGDRRDARRPLEGHHPMRRHRLVAALQREAADRLERDQLSHELSRRLADHDVPVAGLLLEARRHVHGIADDLAVVLGDDLPGVDRDPQPDAALLRSEREERALHLHRGADRAQRVVLRHARRAEHRLDAVAEALCHDAAVGLDGVLHGAVVAVHEGAREFGIQTLVQCGRPGQVGKDDRHDLARDRPLGGLRRERSAAGVAEARVRFEGGAAGRAARGERGPAPAAEARTGAVAAPTAGAVHGDVDGSPVGQAPTTGG